MTNKQIDLPTDGKQNADPDISPQSENRDPATQLMLGKCFLEVYCSEEEHIHGFELILESAEQGNMEAQFRLADLYALGQGTKKNQANAYRWYTKAALQGYKKALIRIHNLYQQDKKMYCRGQLSSNEKGWADEEFKKEHNIRELNEYRREQHAPILNNIVDYYTGQFECYKSSKEENMESDLNLAFLHQYGYGTRKNLLLAFDFYKKVAKQGHKDAQYGLAYLYQTNTDIKFNYRLALRWYRVSATNGNIAAQNCLAYFYEKGLATESSYEAAFYWYTKAANAGSSSAQLNLGRLYRKGECVEKNISEAIKWYKLAADQGNSAARNCLNQLYLTGKISATANSYSVSQPVTFTLRSKLHKDITALKDPERKNILKKLVQHAFMTDGNAMYQIGLKYYNGEDLPQNKDTGFQWIKKAAKAGIEDAELKIARMYEDGDAVDQDYHKSSIWTIKSVKKRNNTALLKLGILYKDGLGVRKDPLEASKWFIKSAEQGNTDARFQFGLLRYHGKGVRQDKKEARECFTKSGLLGNTDAFYQFGWMYQNNDFEGRDIPKEITMYKSTLSPEKYKAEEAIKMYKLSARLGNRDAHFRLAEIYEEGKLTQKDLIKARQHYITAANSNNPYYQTELALKYINGDFGDVIYTTAVDLFKKAAEKNEHRAVRILQTLTQPSNDINSSSKIIDMFNFASAKGIDGIQFSIGHAYEHGITYKDEVIVRKDEKESDWWYSIAAKMGDLRAKYKMQIKNKKESKYQNIVSTFYSIAYESGNSDIAYDLALLYLNGEHVSKDFIRAFNLLTAASNMGHKEARERLVISDKSENMAMLEAVAISGNMAIQYQLGIYFEKKKDSRSIEWLTLAAEGGLNNAYYRLGVLYEEGRITPTDYSKAIVSYEKAIIQDHEDALYRLAQIYHYGRGIEYNYLKSYKLYRRAANIGHIDALKVLNLNEKLNISSREKLKEESQVFSLDELTSIILMLEFVAEQGDIHLQFELGYFYENSEDNQNYSKALKWYTMATAAKHTEAIYRLGLLYENGLGGIQDYSKSLQLYNKAKDQGSHYALYRLGVLFHHGFGVDENPTKAIDCYTKAAKLGNHESQYTLGKLYETGELVQKNIVKALVLYTDAYTNGNIHVLSNLYGLYDFQFYECFFYQKLFLILKKLERLSNAGNNNLQPNVGDVYYRLGKMYFEGIGTIKNGGEALKRFLIAENQYGYSNAKPFTAIIYDEFGGEKDVYNQRMEAYFDIRDTLSSEQQYRIGMLYYNDAKYFYEEDPTKENNTTPLLAASKDDDTAFQYMLLAAKNSHTKAQYQLGIMYLLGHGVQQDEDIAIKWIEKYVKEIEPNHCYKLGLDFYNGNGLNQNYKIASIFMLKAIKEDNHEAQYLLGLMYIHGLGVYKNLEKAAKWLEKSIPKTNKEECYEKGMKIYRDTEVDHRISFAYIKKAAEENHSEAQVQLGVMYYYGHGVEQNYAKAMNCFKQTMKKMNPYQCFNQGMKFYQGIEVEKDDEIALIYITEAAGKNHSEAQAQLGNMHLHGHGVKQNHTKVMKYFQQTMEEMGPYRCYNQGMKFYQGIEVEKNYETAFLYIKNAAEKNYKDAQAQLSVMYLHGHGVEQNQNEAMKCFQQSSIEWDANNCFKQGMKFYNGDRAIKNYEIALIYIKEAAGNNYSEAQAQLGSMYLQGHGVEKNYKEAMSWFQQSTRGWSTYNCFKQGMKFYENTQIDVNYEIALLYVKKAAENNHGQAQTQLGVMYLQGQGIEKSHKEAMKWFQRSIQKWDTYNCYEQGMKFYRGYKVDKNYEVALLYIKKAAKEKYIEAQAQLGLMYLQGHGVEKSHEVAIKWFQRSVQKMDAYDCCKQGMKFYKGDGVDKDYKISLIYIKEAAEKNHSEAQAQLGIMYLQGHGVEESYEEAIKWIQKSIIEMDVFKCYAQGMKIYKSYIIDKSYEIALLYIKKAAEENHSEAQTQLGLMFYYGHGVEQKRGKAIELFEKSTKKMVEFDLYRQGMKFYRENDIDDEMSLIYLEKAAKKNYKKAQVQLGLMHNKGSGVEKNADKVIKWIELSIKNMSSYDCYNYGIRFFCCNVSDQDYYFSLMYLRKSAEKNHIYSQAQLAHMYFHGYGVNQDKKESDRWYDQAVGEYSSHSAYEIGQIYHYDSDGIQNFSKALEWYQQELENGELGPALHGIGLLYEHGDGVSQNYRKAFNYYERASASEHAGGYYNLGLLYYYGKGVDQNYDKAFSLFVRVTDNSFDENMYVFIENVDVYSKNGTVESRLRKYSIQPINRILGESYYYLGLMYRNGQGIVQDKNQARIHFEFAFEFGIESVKSFLK